MRLLRAVLALISMVACSAAFGQGSILQGGTWTPGHVPMYVGSGSSQAIVQDSGPAGGGGAGLGLSELLLTARGTGTAPYAGQGTGPFGTNSCDYDAPTNNPTGYHFLCFSANAQGGGLVAYGAGGAASSLPFNFIVNGQTYQFPFVTGGIVGPSTTVVNDAACWGNTVGTLLKDCGAFVTVGGNNTWTGTNNFTGTFQIGGVTQNFPASGNIVGTSDVQTLTNKNINGSEVNSGTLPATVMPAYTGDVTSSAGATVNSIAAGAVTNAKLAAASSANTVKGAATSTAETDLAVPSCSGASNALQWTTGTGFGCGTLSANTAGFGINLSAGVVSISTTQPPYGFDVPINLGLTASASASALTINVVGANGSAPSATNPVSVPFRSTTLATGTPLWTAITSALSIVIPSAATLGTSNNTPFRIWVFLTYNSGTPQLGVAICTLATTLYPCTAWEYTRTTTTAITGFATSAGTLYATAGVSNDSVRIIGYAEYAAGLATAGSWASAPTTLQLYGPGMKKPGDVIQSIYNPVGTVGNTASNYIISGTAPTAAAGVAGASQAITPTSAVNMIRVTSQVILTSSTANQICVGYVYDGSAVKAVAAAATGAGTGTGAGATIPVTYQALAAAITSVTYSIYATCATGTTTVNGNGGTNQWFGTISNTFVRVEEIMGSLPEPANDNINPGLLSMTG